MIPFNHKLKLVDKAAATLPQPTLGLTIGAIITIKDMDTLRLKLLKIGNNASSIIQ